MKEKLRRMELNLISQLVLSILILLVGVIIMIFKAFGLININLYISILFFILAFLSTIAYFVRRKEGDYELLILSLINVVIATFIYVFKSSNAPMILGASMTLYTILVILNRGYKILVLKRQNNYMWVIKFVITFLIGFLGILTSFNLYNEVTVQTMMFGYYFISLGFMLALEDVIELFITDDKLRKVLSKILEDEPKRDLEEVEVKEKIKNSEPKQKQEKTEIKKLEVKEPEKKKEQTKKVKEPKKKETTNVKETKKKAGRPKKVVEKETTREKNTKVKTSNLK